jgi:hypothetical protein
MLLALAAALVTSAARAADAPKVELVHVPDGGIQPQVAVEGDGTLDVLFFRGDVSAGDLYFARSSDGGATFTKPIRVNHDDRDVIAIGTIRGAQMALGKAAKPGGRTRVHVAWMGTKEAKQRGPGGATPMLYTRLDETGAAFEPERNVIRAHAGLDGGGSVAADGYGNVFVAWHAPREPKVEGEATRTVWLAASHDEGAHFAAEREAWSEPTGCCGCCGMKAFAGDGELLLLYRSATNETERDVYALVSRDGGTSFRGSRVDAWKSKQCVMSTASAAIRHWPTTGGSSPLFAAWEDEGDVAWAHVGGVGGGQPKLAPPPKIGPIVHPPPPSAVAKDAKSEKLERKHPSIAVNARGDVLLAWDEGSGWERGGTLAWQLFSADGKPIDGASGRGEANSVPTWSVPAAAARGDGSFVIVH